MFTSNPTHTFDKSIKEGVFPPELKLAKVVPIFKSDDSSKITNYRSISVLSFFSKVFERVMYNNITDFIDSLNIIYKYQFGFRHKYSTQQAIITLVNKITSSLDTSDLDIGVILDLKKAFDTVDHKILLDKMHVYGIRRHMLRWFHIYLTNRSQFVSYDVRQFAIQYITCADPHGSIHACVSSRGAQSTELVSLYIGYWTLNNYYYYLLLLLLILGPLLFIIYMNDICNVTVTLYCSVRR